MKGHIVIAMELCTYESVMKKLCPKGNITSVVNSCRGGTEVSKVIRSVRSISVLYLRPKILMHGVASGVHVYPLYVLVQTKKFNVCSLSVYIMWSVHYNSYSAPGLLHGYPLHYRVLYFLLSIRPNCKLGHLPWLCPLLVVTILVIRNLAPKL